MLILHPRGTLKARLGGARRLHFSIHHAAESWQARKLGVSNDPPLCIFAAKNEACTGVPAGVRSSIVQPGKEKVVPAVFEYRHQVTANEIDGVGHVNNIEYLRWMQHAAVAHSAAQGWPSAAYYDLGQGWVVRSHRIEYLVPAFSGDEIVVRTWVADMKRVTSTRRYELLRISDGKQLAIASTNWAFVKFATLQPCRVPAEVLNAFELVPDAADRKSV